MRLQSLACTLLLIALSGSVTSLDAQSPTRKKSSRPITRTSNKPAQTPAQTPAQPAPVRIDTSLVVSSTAAGSVADERELFTNAARTAWTFVQRNYQASTGLARAH